MPPKKHGVTEPYLHAVLHEHHLVRGVVLVAPADPAARHATYAASFAATVTFAATAFARPAVRRRLRFGLE